MGNTILLRPWLLDGATVGTVGSEAGGFIAENLQDMNPGLPWRASNLSSVYAEFDFGPQSRWRYVAPLGGIITSTHNLLSYSNDLSDPDWTLDGVTHSTVAAQFDPFGDGSTQRLTEDSSTGFHSVTQRYTGSTLGSRYWVASAYFNTAGQNDEAAIRIYWEGGPGSGGHVEVVFSIATADAANDTNGTSESIGGVLDSYGSEKLDDDWWRVWVIGHVTDASTAHVEAEFLLTDGAGATSYIGDGATYGYIAATQLEDHGSTLPTAPSDYAQTEAAKGARWRWRGSNTAATLSTAPVYDSGYIPYAPDHYDHTGLPEAHGFLDCGSVQKLPFGRIDIDDPGNIDGQVDLSRLFVDEGINLGTSVPFGSPLPGFQEATVERHRTQSDRLVTRGHATKKSDGFNLNVQSRSTVTALQEVSRRQGSSKDVLLLHDPSGVNTQEGMVHGVLNGITAPVLAKPGLWKMSISIEEL